MPKFNLRRARPAPTSPVTGEAVASGRTFEGGPGYVRDTRSELFLLAVTNMVGEHTYYESADRRDTRYANLVRAAALSDPDWTAQFLRWLRTEANMRTASLVGAAEFVKARLDAGVRGGPVTNRSVIDSVLRRADEPGELLAYWTALYGRALPMPVKRGVADAVLRLGTEFNYVKWDSEGRGYRFADVLNLTHPGDRRGSAQRIRGQWQHDLFGHIVKRRYEPGLAPPETLPLLTRRKALLALPVDERRQVLENPDLLAEAGMTWEALAGWLQGPMDAAAWEAVIGSMGLMALVRNLRNFDEAGVSDEVAARVAERISDPEQVARSRMLPMRYLSAYRAAPSARWAWPLERALTHSLANVPTLPGRTLVLVDTSGSMHVPFSKDGTLARWDAAAVFGIALASRCASADVVSFSDDWQGRPPSRVFPPRKGESLLRAVDRWRSDGYFIGGGTETADAVRANYRAHDRVVILTDEQASAGDVDKALPRDTPLYTWNLAGYQYGHTPSGGTNRHTFGGLTDQAFTMVPLLEAGHNASWPF
ncbi:TROVE domain-containing protein [Actinokineospora auranticolor]|uniref:TROVE domain-containing protein n=1 Tax=Actinokineospora auranticolor TaxID=155976 RepID=A0A2S6H116_9PSEU|nr:TROVE domain-containing protein [Actinokineospora auranticolor]PPK71107.1 TROVE domain-containing protein [Actinokineospora auranticolor]